MHDEPDASWPLEPMDEVEARSLTELLVVFAKGCLGGAATVFGLGLVLLPSLTHTQGASRSWVLQKQKRQRCLERGLTLEELEAQEGGAAGGGGAPRR